jgi:hypothetical protein
MDINYGDQYTLKLKSETQLYFRVLSVILPL